MNKDEIFDFINSNSITFAGAAWYFYQKVGRCAVMILRDGDRKITGPLLEGQGDEECDRLIRNYDPKKQYVVVAGEVGGYQCSFTVNPRLSPPNASAILKSSQKNRN